ncbi:MAG: Signal recognition particle receptor FtsY [Syntrophorhabdaceae bacterium PtaU1.Bin034]|nr:MAG: Signal recognition particle receptor FtsY [Syntrophorhabdaceae bacterium PtaU1.Bin034]
MGLFDKLKSGLTKTRAQIQTQLEWMMKGKTLDEAAFDGIEEAVILADGGLEVAEILVHALKEKWKMGRIKTEEDLKKSMVDEIEKLLAPVQQPLRIDDIKPFVILTLGVNGVGKTTTIAKLARIFLGENKKVLLGACDTFRAAAIEQLEVWGERLGVETIKHQHNADPAAVAYDAVKAAKARGVDVLILDSAGRLHTKVNLMEEMKKIKRVAGKELEGAPHETLLVVDATNGQNAIAQAEKFHEALSLTGMVITKLDGTAKGGFVLPIAHSLNIPIRYIGVGEKMDDLIPFSAREFAEGMVPDQES